MHHNLQLAQVLTAARFEDMTTSRAEPAAGRLRRALGRWLMRVGRRLAERRPQPATTSGC